MPKMTIFRFEVLFSVLMLGTAAGASPAAVAQATSPKSDTYTVKPGDTLFSIARALYGDETMWAELYRLNSATIADPKWIRPGQVLTLARRGAAPTVPVEETPRPAPVTAEKAPEKAPEKPPEKTPEIIKPTPQPERRPVVVEPEPEQQPSADTLFKKRRGLDAYSALRTYREQPYRALRRGEFHAAGFLTEGESLPLGKMLGPVTPQQIRNMSERSTATLGTEVAVLPPKGAQYQVNDSLLVVAVLDGPEGFGDVILPTGMLRIIGHSGGQALGRMITVYGPARTGQYVLPTEKFVDGGSAHALPVENGVVGKVLAQREVRELKHPHNFLFLNVGKNDGVSRGDLFEVRRDPRPRTDAADTIDEPMAVLQVVHVRGRSSTAKILNVISPDIPPMSRVKQIGKLPS